MNSIKLRGVSTHNLRHLDVEIPYRSLVVITGVSGSGKSSLAFDTLYAEGQRRYVESISSYARQFLERMEKPDLESIQGILPSIAIEAKNVVTNARSTVGTQTELNDYLRLLFARIGKTYCSGCARPIVIDTAESVGKELLELHLLKTVRIGFSIVMPKVKHHIKSILEEYQKQGFIHAEINGQNFDLSQSNVLDVSISSVWFVVDDIEVSLERKKRIIESLETAFRYGKGRADIEINGEKHPFSNRFSCARCNLDYKLPTPNLFSFNSPLGACSECQGFGRVMTIDWNLVIPDPRKSVAEGVIEPWTKPSAHWEFKQLKNFCKRKKISLDKPFSELSQSEKSFILEGSNESDYFSVKDFFAYLEKKKYKMHVRIFLSKYRAFRICPLCKGSRLKAESLLVKIGDHHIVDWSRMSIEALRKFFTTGLNLTKHEEEIAAPVLLEIRKRLRFLDEVGLGYLTLDRASRTLSGGEAQRINLATSLGSALVDTLYVLDEPSIGLHERDNHLLIRLLHELRDLGNTVVIVEHDRSMIETADWIIDMGPLGGERGGEIMFAGSFGDLRKSKNSITAKYFRSELVLEREQKENQVSGETIQIKGATHHNLKNVSVEIPLQKLVVISGVSGSGKSTLMNDVLYANYLRFRGRPVSDVGTVKKIEGFSRVQDVVFIDQSPIGRTPRSNPATYIKVFDDIRKLFARTRDAKAKRFDAGHFSFNVPGGRCEKCRGEGLIKVEMHFLADVYITCDDCNGSRYQAPVLEIRYRGKNIQEVLQMTVEEAAHHFSEERNIVDTLSILSQMGLDYLRLGQPATTLSGGEAQRMKLAVEMTRSDHSNLLYLFDEPTTGLHYRDISFLLACFDRLLEKGHSICVIEHNMEIIRCADYLIDLGPEGGEKGGEVVYAGPVNDGLLNHPISYTGQYLKRHFSLKSV